MGLFHWLLVGKQQALKHLKGVEGGGLGRALRVWNAHVQAERDEGFKGFKGFREQ